MSKRTQSIRSMFSAPQESSSSATKAPASRVTSGAVRSLKDTFSEAERSYQDLREQLATGNVAIEIDPTLIDPSPFADRFDEQDAVSFESLKLSIRDRGQEIPVLVRDHPTVAGRYQSAYGHRRVKAARDLGIKVKAYVRLLSDEDLVVAQGVENSAREDLSYIERAVFALKLEGAGFQRAVVQSALSIDRAETSKLIAVAKSIPADLLVAIGRAPKVGRGRWQTLAEHTSDPIQLLKIREAIKADEFRAADTNERVTLLLQSSKPREALEKAKNVVVLDGDGEEIAELTRGAKKLRIQVGKTGEGDFADYLVGKLPDLYRSYKSERKDNDPADNT
ncbi:plasmid partitioning protein RepB [Agrobacterium vitis]|uniref:plasmid partitioning protein RepB n=1 Tax=Agrobacterium vitis TaxID=373 RepID=UPI0012E7EF1F|nr:plasmid partitioning protein RepB [Agrobacterium vitis]MVA52667.1 plasmid partitioning protein RepB [Agrobacterium vitis]MVA64121.1 plasmid partitioning protein RepB [Agrobacterium vitis]